MDDLIPVEPKLNNTVKLVAFSVVISTLFIGGGIFAFQQSKINKQNIQIRQLQSKITIEQDNGNTEESVPPTQGAKYIPYETITNGGVSNVKERTSVIVKDEEAWNEVYNSINNVIANYRYGKLENINFRKDMVLAVYLGSRSSGGYVISIEYIEETKDALNIYVVETTPQSGPGTVVGHGFTQPYHIIKTKKTDKEIKFIDVKTPPIAPFTSVDSYELCIAGGYKQAEYFTGANKNIKMPTCILPNGKVFTDPDAYCRQDPDASICISPPFNLY